MHSYEIEIKSLLGKKEYADALRERLRAKIPGLKHTGSGSELNHYFNPPENFSALEKAITPFLSKDKTQTFKKILNEGRKVSIRTRQAQGKTLFIIKASIGSDTSENGVSRIEFETEMSKTLKELDGMLLKAGLTYQAKWSRDREEYESKDHNMHITIDKNAGYGYVAEFEKVAREGVDAKAIEKELRSFMKELDVEELPQDRLERMFAHYNANWQDYYGTDKVFTIE